MKKSALLVLMNRKVTLIVQELSILRNVTHEKVFYDFIKSDTCKKLYDEKTKYWRESIPYIIESYDLELKGLPINDDY